MSNYRIGDMIAHLSDDGTMVLGGRITAPDEGLPFGASWIVDQQGDRKRWHSATIITRIDDWADAYRLDGAHRALKAMVDEIVARDPSMKAGAAFAAACAFQRMVKELSA